MYTELVKYINRQKKSLERIKALQKENKTLREANVAQYPEKFERSERMHALVQETKRLDAEYSKLHEKELVYGLRIRLAVCSIVALICASIREEVKEGGKLYGVSSHYKKFAAVVEEKVREAGLDGLRTWLDLSFSRSLFLNWEYGSIRRECCYLGIKGINAVVELPENPVDQVVYPAGDIDKVVAGYLREEKACYRMVSALEKKAHEISRTFTYCVKTGIGQTDVLIYGRTYGERP